jgi:hypothetical protein
LRIKKFPCAIALFALISPALVLAQDVAIISPPENRAVTSPVRVVADFPRHTEISSISVSVDGAEIPQAEAVTPLDIQLAVPEGRHLLSVKAVQADGAFLSSSRWITVSGTQSDSTTEASAPRKFSATNLSATNLSSTSLSTTAVSTTTYTATSPLVKSNIEQMSGWYTYPDQGNPTCSSKPALVSSPSLDGISGRFYLGPNGQFQNCLWPILLGSNSTVTHFKLDVHYRLSNPSSPQGVEFSSNKHIGTKWYKFSVQCSYYKGYFSVWDTAGGKWVATSIPCKRPASGTWDHLTVNTAISSGKAVFQSITFNGVTHTVNKSFYPLTKSSSYSYGVHVQMDGNRAGNSYYMWVDELTYNLW